MRDILDDPRFRRVLLALAIGAALFGPAGIWGPL